MDVFDSLENENRPWKRELGENILKHADDLLADGKISEGQYLDFCNGAGLIHQGIMMTQNQVTTVTRVIDMLCRKVQDAKSREITFRKHIKSLQTRASLLRTRIVNNASALESAIQKKEYTRARSMIQDQRNNGLDMVFEFDEPPASRSSSSRSSYSLSIAPGDLPSHRVLSSSRVISRPLAPSRVISRPLAPSRAISRPLASSPGRATETPTFRGLLQSARERRALAER